MKGLKAIYLALFFFCLLAAGPALASKVTIKIGYPDATMTKVGDYALPFPTYAAMLTFKNAVEASTQGEVSVEIFAGGSLGDHRSNLEQILIGNIQMAGPSDGPIANFYRDIQVFSIPYLFADALDYYTLMDGKFMQGFFDDMAKKSGLRIISTFENGGFRNFSNSKRQVKTAADMKGLKIRTMEIPSHMEIVKALGGAPTPIAWTELYTSLQTGVVDGQENSPLTTMLGSIQEVQKYYTLDGHILGPAFLVIGEDFYQGLSKEHRKAVDEASVKATLAARGVVRVADSLALQALIDDPGIEVYKPTPAELDSFKVAQKPVVEYLKKNINKDYVEQILIESEKVTKARLN